ncbi:MAG: hypothetical protein IT392_04430 [Nitrospirae bacterium]|nr:hypothetical protein [Nitrospirota bacterium]
MVSFWLLPSVKAEALKRIYNRRHPDLNEWEKSSVEKVHSYEAGYLGNVEAHQLTKRMDKGGGHCEYDPKTLREYPTADSGCCYREE